MSCSRTAIYPGTFDPLTNGHLDLIRRAGHLFDQLIVAVARHTGKETLFDEHERVELVKRCTVDLDFVQVTPFSGLLVEFARQQNISIIVRGMRATSDFDFEFQIALSNRKMWPELETTFLLTSEAFSFMSSSLVRQVARLGGNLTPFVPSVIKDAITGKIISLREIESN